MAMLLAMYQKMRLIREVNQETLNVARFSTKVDRIAKNIKNVQKFYESKLKNLESMAKYQISVFRQGLMMQYDQQSLIASAMETNSKGNINIKNIWDAYKNGKLTNDKDGNILAGSTKVSSEDYKNFQNLMTQAQYSAHGVQQQANWIAQSNEEMINAQLTQIKAQVEAEQEAALDPLEYEQTMMELDKEASEERLTRLKAELDSYKQLCSEEAKNSAPRFGLG